MRVCSLVRTASLSPDDDEEKSDPFVADDGVGDDDGPMGEFSSTQASSSIMKQSRKKAASSCAGPNTNSNMAIKKFIDWLRANEKKRKRAQEREKREEDNGKDGWIESRSDQKNEE